jgi:hypothetical protein
MTKRRDEGVEVGKTNGSTAPSDSLVLFGVTGDLAHKMIFPATPTTGTVRTPRFAASSARQNRA